jgi:hypothetical protein
LTGRDLLRDESDVRVGLDIEEVARLEVTVAAGLAGAQAGNVDGGDDARLLRIGLVDVEAGIGHLHVTADERHAEVPNAERNLRVRFVDVPAHGCLLPRKLLSRTRVGRCEGTISQEQGTRNREQSETGEGFCSVFLVPGSSAISLRYP